MQFLTHFACFMAGGMFGLFIACALSANSREDYTDMFDDDCK